MQSVHSWWALITSGQLFLWVFPLRHSPLCSYCHSHPPNFIRGNHSLLVSWLSDPLLCIFALQMNYRQSLLQAGKTFQACHQVMPVAANGKQEGRKCRFSQRASDGKDCLEWHPQDNHYVLWSMMFNKDISLWQVCSENRGRDRAGEQSHIQMLGTLSFLVGSHIC